VNKKIAKTKDEDEIMKEARRLVLEAHKRLVSPTKKTKEDVGKKTRRIRTKKKTDS